MVTTEKTRTKPTAAEIRARRAEEEAVLEAELAEQEADAKRRRSEHVASLPQVRFEPAPAVVQGEKYVTADRKVMAYDPADQREYMACVPGSLLREEYARKIGLEAEAQVLSWRPESPE